MSEDNYGKERPRLQRADDISSEKKKESYTFFSCCYSGTTFF